MKIKTTFFLFIISLSLPVRAYFFNKTERQEAVKKINSGKCRNRIVALVLSADKYFYPETTVITSAREFSISNFDRSYSTEQNFEKIIKKSLEFQKNNRNAFHSSKESKMYSEKIEIISATNYSRMKNIFREDLFCLAKSSTGKNFEHLNLESDWADADIELYISSQKEKISNLSKFLNGRYTSVGLDDRYYVPYEERKRLPFSAIGNLRAYRYSSNGLIKNDLYVHSCTAFLIGSCTALTSAHCVVRDDHGLLPLAFRPSGSSDEWLVKELYLAPTLTKENLSQITYSDGKFYSGKYTIKPNYDYAILVFGEKNGYRIGEKYGYLKKSETWLSNKDFFSGLYNYAVSAGYPGDKFFKNGKIFRLPELYANLTPELLIGFKDPETNSMYASISLDAARGQSGSPILNGFSEDSGYIGVLSSGINGDVEDYTEIEDGIIKSKGYANPIPNISGLKSIDCSKYRDNDLINIPKISKSISGGN